MTRTATRRLLATLARGAAPAGWMLGVPLPIQAVTTWTQDSTIPPTNSAADPDPAAFTHGRRQHLHDLDELPLPAEAASPTGTPSPGPAPQPPPVAGGSPGSR